MYPGMPLNCTQLLKQRCMIYPVKCLTGIQETYKDTAIKGALYRIWCGVNRLGDSGVKVV